MFSYSKFPKGSEWRKWDLHIHTPFSYLNNEFGDNWDEYVRQLFLRALINNIAVIGITDYFTIEGYKKLKIDYLDNPEKMKELFPNENELRKIEAILILPNIEFRLNKLVGPNRINFHVILSNEIPINDIEENFLHELDFIYEAGPQSEDEKRKLKIKNLEELGTKLNKEHEKFKDQSPIFTGMMNAVVDDFQINSLLANKRNIFEDKYFILLPCDEDLSKVSWNAQDHQARKLLIQKADMLMTSNPKSINWALGKTYDKTEDFVIEFKSLKPCIWGSDAHKYEELFIKNSDRLLWIKADPTFEGLKQLVYEPEDRVKIQPGIPEEKTGYQIIDKLIIRNGDIYNDWLEINANLNSIIGGRSTGKSILLGAIAKKLKALRPLTFSDGQYGAFIKSVSDTITVIWKDGKEENNREVEYFHQGYMHEIAKDDNQLSTLIQEILIQKGKESHLITYDREIADNSKKISSDIVDFYQVAKTINDKKQKALDKGDKKGIEDEIAKLEEELKQMNITTLSDGDKQAYEKIKNEINSAEQFVSLHKRDMDLLISLKSLSLIRETISFEITSLSQEIKDEVIGVYELIKKESLEKWTKELDSLCVVLVQKIITLEKGKNLMLLDPLVVRVSTAYKENAQLAELEEKIQVQKIKLFEIKELLNEINDLQKQQGQFYKEIKNGQQKFYSIIISLIPHLSDSQEGLDIKAKPKFDEKQYQDILFSAINQQSYANQTIANFLYTDNENFEKHLFELLHKLVLDEITLKGSQTSQTLIARLLATNFYILTYDLEYEGDDFRKMSDGKKAFVILKLLLDFSNKACPILIDQPEDDLDNRAIYNDLVQYLRKKKKLRQIILATHNPNIVVGADSELIICANQHGNKNANTGNKKFQYVTGSLEHTFEKVPAKYEVLEAQGTREHVCEVLEGGNVAFKLREKKYSIKV